MLPAYPGHLELLPSSYVETLASQLIMDFLGWYPSACPCRMNTFQGFA